MWVPSAGTTIPVPTAMTFPPHAQGPKLQVRQQEGRVIPRSLIMVSWEWLHVLKPLGQSFTAWLLTIFVCELHFHPWHPLLTGVSTLSAPCKFVSENSQQWQYVSARRVWAACRSFLTGYAHACASLLIASQHPLFLGNPVQALLY